MIVRVNVVINRSVDVDSVSLNSWVQSFHNPILSVIFFASHDWFVFGSGLYPLITREDKGEREGISHTHPILYVIRLELFLRPQIPRAIRQQPLT